MIIKDEYLDLHTEESVTYCTESLAVADTIKHETPGVEESAVIVVECTTVKEEIKENMDTEDPLSVHILQGKLYSLNILLSSKLLHSSLIICLSLSVQASVKVS